MTMVQMIVGRCHVYETNRQVLKYVISRLKHKRKTWVEMPKEKRRDLMIEVFQAHAVNRDVYDTVMHGKG